MSERLCLFLYIFLFLNLYIFYGEVSFVVAEWWLSFVAGMGDVVTVLLAIFLTANLAMFWFVLTIIILMVDFVLSCKRIFLVLYLLSICCGEFSDFG